jgi:preprotein translocase subunit SecA
VFGNLFGKKSSVQHHDDQVWKTTAACLTGLCAEAVQSAAGARSVIVVCLTNAAFDAVDAVLAPHQPTHCRDLFGRDALRSALARPHAMTVALSGSLPADTVAANVPVEIIVYGRNATRTADDAIHRFAEKLGAQVAITFHLSLEDALLKPFVDTSLPMLEQLGLKDDEALSHAFITRAIQNCQSP